MQRKRRDFMKAVSTGSLGVAVGVSGCLSEEEVEVEGFDQSSIADADIDWRKHEGEELTLGFVEHPFVDNFEPLEGAFEELTGISLNWDVLPESEFRTQRDTDLTTEGGNWDVFMTDQVVTQYYESGWLQPLDDYFDDDDLYDENWYRTEDIFDASVDACHAAGTADEWTGLPITVEALTLFYRTDLYEEYDLEEPETMDELLDNVETISENEDMPGVVARGERGFGMNIFILNSYIRSWGGDLWAEYPERSGLDSDEAIAAAEFYVDMLQEYGPADAASYEWSDVLAAMQQGQAGHIATDANLFYPDLTDPDESVVADDLGIAEMPVPDGGRFAPNAFTWQISTQRAADNPEAAWLFMLFATCQETQEWMGEQGASFLTRQSAWETDAYREQVGEEFAEVSMNSLNGAIGDEFDVNYPEWGEEYSTELQAAIDGGKSVEEAMTDAARTAEDIVN
ncbi:extracellular solute-binding protein [Natrarchaeobius sp. A-rgal3]|uniref:extracellular solute-binding protein n=1 Tax=Natrarchaeobius versutus TaxID=1679078 RepID=UPI00350F2174